MNAETPQVNGQVLAELAEAERLYSEQDEGDAPAAPPGLRLVPYRWRITAHPQVQAPDGTDALVSSRDPLGRGQDFSLARNSLELSAVGEST